MHDSTFGDRVADVMAPMIKLLEAEKVAYVFVLDVSDGSGVVTMANIPPSKQVPILEEALRVAKRGTLREQGRN